MQNQEQPINFNDILAQLTEVIKRKKYRTDQIQNTLTHFRNGRINFEDCINYMKINDNISLLCNNKFNNNIDQFNENDRQKILIIGKWISMLDETCIQTNIIYGNIYQFAFFTKLLDVLTNESKMLVVNKINELINELNQNYEDVE
jgi:hypothetical protein